MPFTVNRVPLNVKLVNSKDVTVKLLIPVILLLESNIRAFDACAVPGAVILL